MTAPIPEGYEGLTPYLLTDDAAAAIDFYKRAFDAEELMRLPGPGGTVGHAELKIAGSVVMLADDPGDMEHRQHPKALGGTTVNLMFYVEDCDAAIAKAEAAGAEVVRPPEDQFYGDRAGGIRDPFGHEWSIHTHVRDVTDEEVAAAMKEMLED